MKNLKAFIFKTEKFQEVTTQTPNLSNHFDDDKGADLENDCEFNIVENVTIQDRNFNGLTISGSLFSLTTFINVSFDSCIIFATRIENCTFINCKFINCNFEFSNCSYNKFEECIIDSSLMTYTPFKNNTFYKSELPFFLFNKFQKENKLKESRPRLPIDSIEETKTLLHSIIHKKFVA